MRHRAVPVDDELLDLLRAPALDELSDEEDRAGDEPTVENPAIPTGWPAPPDEAAYHGLAGDIVRTVTPHTEADPIALLIHILVAAGNIWGRGPYFRVGGARHFTNENAICIGKTASARKGTAQADTFNLLKAVDPGWIDRHVLSGLSTGEGLIYSVRDKIEKDEPIRGKGRTITGYQTLVVDKGIIDKRLLVMETEFVSVLRVSGREGNTLSAVYRQAWDSGALRVVNKNSPLRATDAHISIIGHITRDELLMELSNSDKVNGFGNRNLWVCVRRSKYLPDGGDWDRLDLNPFIDRLQESMAFARAVGEMRRDEEAHAMWHGVYPQLSGERAGLFGAMTSRAEAHVLRLSCIYALLDHSATVRRPHLEAALAVWKYCEDSVAFIFGDGPANQVAARILRALRDTPDGLTRDAIRDLFKRHRTSEEITIALRLLTEGGTARCEREDTGGRAAERWFAAESHARKARKG